MTLRFKSDLGLGSCSADAELKVIEEGPEPRDVTETWSFDCTVVATGVGDWMAVSYGGPAYDGPIYARTQLSDTERPILYFRTSQRAVLVPPYSEPLLDTGWMTGAATTP